MQKIFTVTELSSAVKQLLEMRFPSIAVQGEVSNLKEQSSGHFYFTLKDKDSQIAAVLFRGNTRSLARMPKNGDQVVVKGEINVYAPRGNYQIIVRELNLVGIGELLLKLHEMKLKIQERGWFDKARKKALPKYPKTIGVVTSPTGAVIQDIVHILTRRLSRFRLILNPVKVQGEGAAQEIALAIEQFNQFQLADVLIIGRGGGSLEDLWAFNEEVVAKAVFHSHIPIICAVGHETDFCIADFVADVRAPTPSAAAEIVTTATAEQTHFLSQTRSRLKQVVHALVTSSKRQLEALRRHPYLASPYTFLAPHLQRIDVLDADLREGMHRQLEDKRVRSLQLEKQLTSLHPQHRIVTARSTLLSFDRALLIALRHQLSAKKAMVDALSWQKKIASLANKSVSDNKMRLTQLAAHLKSIDPNNLLTKGFCILFREDNTAVVSSVHELYSQDKVRLLLGDGSAHLTVESVVYPIRFKN